MLNSGKKLQAYRFKGYWRDVGTLASLHQANMDIIAADEMNLFDNDSKTRIYTEDTYSVPQYVGNAGFISHSIANQGAVILGHVTNCVISNEAIIGEGAICTDCVIMEGAYIKKGARVHKAIIGPGTIIEEKERINEDGDSVVLIARRNK